MQRRKFLKISGLGLVSVATSSIAGFAKAATDGPIRIGLMAPLTGVAAAGGREMVEGFQLWWENQGQKAAGRAVQVIIEDDGSNPDTALQKARRLVEQSNVDFLVGNLLANTGLAVANYVQGTGTPYLIPLIAADDLTQRNRIANVLRVAGFAASQETRVLADWALKKGYKRVATIAQDYAFGHEQCGGFAQTFSEGGGAVVKQFWHPLNTSDFSPYLGQIQELKIDCLLAAPVGADATRFMQQWSAFGLKGTVPLLGGQNTTDQSIIRTMGAEVEGIVTAAHFAEGNSDQVTQQFVRAYEQKYNKLPSLYGTSLYVCAMWLTGAIEAIRGGVEDRTKFLKALIDMKLEGSPFGAAVRLDPYGNPIYDVYIRKVEKRESGKYWNVPQERYDSVSQFWKYNPDEYLKQPPFSRSFQGIKA